MKYIASIFLFGCVTLTLGCGQTGNLYLPNNPSCTPTKANG